MSLRTIHIFLIITAILLCAGFAVWALDQYRGTGQGGYAIYAAFSAGSGLLLAIYLPWFLKKTKSLKS